MSLKYEPASELKLQEVSEASEAQRSAADTQLGGQVLNLLFFLCITLEPRVE